MFERFTDRARRVVVLAQEEARVLNHDHIGTEHLLLGLICEGEGVAARALQSLNVSLEETRDQVKQIIGQGRQAPSGHIPFTPRAKKVLELSLREALQLGHNYIGTEHILLGLIREGEGVAAQVLVELGCELTKVRLAIIKLLADRQAADLDEEKLLRRIIEKAQANASSAQRRLMFAKDRRDREMLSQANAEALDPASNQDWPGERLLAMQARLDDCEEAFEEAESLFELLSAFVRQRQ